MNNKTIHRLSDDPRACHLAGQSTPRTELRVKQFKCVVKCAADFPRRISHLEEMHMFEEQFRAIARDHGFNATEVLESW